MIFDDQHHESVNILREAWRAKWTPIDLRGMSEIYCHRGDFFNNYYDWA